MIEVDLIQQVSIRTLEGIFSVYLLFVFVPDFDIVCLEVHGEQFTDGIEGVKRHCRNEFEG